MEQLERPKLRRGVRVHGPEHGYMFFDLLGQLRCQQLIGIRPNNEEILSRDDANKVTFFSEEPQAECL
jgi:hypothetical protein